MQQAQLDSDFITRFRSGKLTEAEAISFTAQPQEVVVFTLLALAGGEATATAKAHQPPGTIPPFQKPASEKKKSHGKPGARKGHPGSSRARPERIDHHATHQLPCCPACQGKLVRTGDTRTRVTEDMPVDMQVEATEHTIHSDWCPRCKKRVEPQPPDVLPRCTLGNRLLAFAAWLHYGNGATISQIVEVLNFHLQTKITPGGLVQMWHRLAEILYPWYEQLHRECLDAAVLHADETGWRVNGTTHWLWCFAREDTTFFPIDRSRGHPALSKLFVDEFNGVLVTDFWAAYDAFASPGSHQRCWPHLLRELDEVDKTSTSDEWTRFARATRRIYTDAIRLHARRSSLAEDERDVAIARLELRLGELARTDWTDRHAARLAKRLDKHGRELLTFLWHDAVPADNNFAERALRPAVLIRKNSYANASDRGALTQAVLMSIYRTLRQRGSNPLEVIPTSLRALATTGQLPPLAK